VATAEYLLEHETMDGEEFALFCDNGGTMPPQTEKDKKQGSGAGDQGSGDGGDFGDFPELPVI